jgi:paraquat-inducible protein B
MAKEVEVTALIPAESQDRIQKALEFFHSLRELKITSQQEYDSATDLIKQVKTNIKALEDDRTLLVKPFKEKATAIDTHYRGVKVQLENAERVIKGGMSQWFQEQERKRLEVQRKLEAEAEAKRQAAEEAARKEAEKAELYRQQGREDMAAKAEARMETAQAVA